MEIQDMELVFGNVIYIPHWLDSMQDKPGGLQPQYHLHSTLVRFYGFYIQ